MFNFFKKKKQSLGLIGPDKYDSRDFQLCNLQVEEAELPESFDLISKMSEVGRQNWGSCTSWGTTSVAEYLNNIEYGKKINLSEKFVYINTKRISGLWNTQGDYGRNALKAICKWGAPLLKYFPDEREDSWEEYVKPFPPDEIYEKAKEFRGKTYWRVGRKLSDFRQAIYQQKAPVSFGMMWARSYRQPDSDGRLPLPDKEVGGHLVSCVGWDKEKLLIRNSHGKNWGRDGYCYIPFDKFDKHQIWDCWILLDLPKPEDLEGWVATKYLRKQNKFNENDKIETTTRLNIREEPSGKVIATLDKGQTGEVLIAEETLKDGYRWVKIKTKE